MNLTGLKLKDAIQKIDFKYSLIIFSVLVFWSSSYIGIRYALNHYSPGNLGFLRYFTASVAFLGMALFSKFTIPKLIDLPGLAALGFFGFTLYNLLLNYGEITIDAGTSSFVINTVPFFTLLFAIVMKEEIARKKDWIGMLIAFSGVAFIIFSKNESHRAFSWNIVLILGAAICQALYFTIQKRYLKKYTPLELTTYAIWIGTFLMFFFTKKPFLAISSAPLSYTFTIVYLGIFPGAVAFLLMGFALNKYKLSNVSSYLFLIPFITIIIAWFTIDEAISLKSALGGLFIIVGILVKNKSFGIGKLPLPPVG
jgi:drug/metabolite transporter (DMT)-like permease